MLKNNVFKVSVDTRKWVKATAVRTVKTMSQSVIAVIGTSTVMGSVNWVLVGSSALLSGILCILMAVAGLPEVSSEKEDEV